MTDVYLVDDHAMMRDGLRSVLEGAGHRVVGEADEPTRALAEIQALRPEVLLLDLNLGLHSGIDLLTAMQRRHLSTKTIVLTMSPQPRHVAEALRLGAAAYLLKGAPADDLMAAIEQVLKGQTHLGSGVANLAVRGMSNQGEGASVDALSERERQVVTLVVRGRSSMEIGTLLHLSPKTVDSYRSRSMAKIGVADVPALVRFAIRARLIDAEDE